MECGARPCFQGDFFSLWFGGERMVVAGPDARVEGGLIYNSKAVPVFGSVGWREGSAVFRSFGGGRARAV